MVGKEITRFHAVYWPAFLMAAELPLPKQIFAHGWLLFEQEKMSKSKGNVAYPEPIVKVLGNDALRYYLLREVVFGQDGNFSREALITRYNADLANGLGNLASRTLTMIEQYFDGRIPDKPGAWPNDRDGQIERLKQDTISDATGSYDRFDFSHALEAIWRLVGEIDRYLVEFQPWVLAKDANQRRRLETVLFVAYDAVRVATFLAHPALPEATQRIWTQLGQDGDLGTQSFNDLPWGRTPKPPRIGKTEAVFPRAEKSEVLERIEAMENEIRNPGSTPPADAAATSAATPGGSTTTSAAAAPAAMAASAKITIDDFAKVELCVGVVKSADRIQGADKLLKLMVDIGDEVRQVLAGIALGYTPEELVGRKVVIVTNLAPRKMRGLESNGMLLAASSGADGKPVLCTFAEDIPVGSKVK
jgi:methionyl-tRNA synthetase